MTAEQIPFDLMRRPALGRDDFVVTQSNTAALTMVEAPRWPGGRLALTGPAASGKTHLAHAWATASDAVVVAAAQLPRLDIATLAGAGRVAVEDVPLIAGQRGAENALFHLYNRLGGSGGQLLVTGRTPPARWKITLPDLRSRLSAMTVAAIEPPDDALLGALLEKQFRDRGIEAKLPTMIYLVTRMPRTAEAARDIADELNRLSYAQKRPISRELAKEALARLGASPDRHEDNA